MLDHFVFNVPKAQFSDIVTWYLTALAPLTYTKQYDYPGQACGLGTSPDAAPFWIGASDTPGASGFHLAFKAKSHEEVDRFHAAALKAGGTCNGKPGLREMYGPNYYGAFVLDPLGNNIEVVDKTVAVKE
ncbi:Glyoxalase/Bleomycin resistance protein/Dihydroxybiphenyl dioxygenase [Bimuria novae-zelandiae CBS 107.79]|uniref:Glyoxalase/Bleomycin resistance protein/Dihydroxybiphenyl dioxygenase n=1 Tax=Bimuria novae-zelandiae CBS 107.79 TaxID=1447943 RepID=A0A6A5UTE5_9PLEO|nr:Glyoxalase/Bleomycin resistance protein/Dihydroxybiphenyl dioxygenase [Bimuria novae-zelandiae CBS 107.79]